MIIRFIWLATLIIQNNLYKYLPVLLYIKIYIYLYHIMISESKEERYFYFNSLAILIKAVENVRTIIDLRNEASVYGIVEHADA